MRLNSESSNRRLESPLFLERLLSRFCAAIFHAHRYEVLVRVSGDLFWQTRWHAGPGIVRGKSRSIA